MENVSPDQIKRCVSVEHAMMICCDKYLPATMHLRHENNLHVLLRGDGVNHEIEALGDDGAKVGLSPVRVWGGVEWKKKSQDEQER